VDLPQFEFLHTFVIAPIAIIARAGRALCLYLESFVRIQSVAMKSAGPNCENFVLRVAQDQKYLDQ